jgi:hypothetical protein
MNSIYRKLAGLKRNKEPKTKKERKRRVLVFNDAGKLLKIKIVNDEYKGDYLEAFSEYPRATFLNVIYKNNRTRVIRKPK